MMNNINWEVIQQIKQLAETHYMEYILAIAMIERPDLTPEELEKLYWEYMDGTFDIFTGDLLDFERN